MTWSGLTIVDVFSLLFLLCVGTSTFAQGFQLFAFRGSAPARFHDAHFLFLGSSFFRQNHLFSLANPLHVAVQLTLQLLLSAKFQESLAVLYSFSLFGKFTVKYRTKILRAMFLCQLQLILGHFKTFKKSS